MSSSPQPGALVVDSNPAPNVPSHGPETGAFYFAKYEGRQPPAAVPASRARDFVYQALASAAFFLGVRYLVWRWTSSISGAPAWFAIPLVVAETLAFGGTVLFFLSIWRLADTPRSPCPVQACDVRSPGEGDARPLVVDVFFPTYNEDVELVRLSVRDAKLMTYPHPIDVRIHVLDDGKRDEMKRVAAEEGVGYLTRSVNTGFKAGNIRNAMEQTSGDLLVICDADTRPLPSLLEETLGYFRDPAVAWVQTPQWFYDIDEGTSLTEWLTARLGGLGRLAGRAAEGALGPIKLGADPLGNDPRMFYDVIQRRRNWANAAFCCGAGSVHRRDAVMEGALKALGASVEATVAPIERDVACEETRGLLSAAVASEAAREIELTPYKFHVSEDIYTSIVLHADSERRWKSVFHPAVVSKMLSPQDLLTWSIQRFKYAGGTLDIFLHDSPLRRKGLDAWQKLAYGATAYSYLAPLWTVVFLLAPAIYLFTGLSAVSAYDADFYSHLVPFLILNRLAYMAATWGVSTQRGEQYYLAFFWLNIKALVDVALGRPVKFHVTPKTKQSGNHGSLVAPHLTIVGLYAVGTIVGAYRVASGGGADLGPLLVNLFWTAHNAAALSIIVRAAFRKVESS